MILFFESRGAALEAVLWGLASGVFYAGVVLSLRHLRDMESAWLAAVNHLVDGAGPGAFVWAVSGAIRRRTFPSGIQWLLLAGFGILQMGLPYVLFARGLRSIPGHEATGIGLMEPILVPVWVLLAWGDQPGLVDARRRRADPGGPGDPLSRRRLRGSRDRIRPCGFPAGQLAATWAST